MIKPDDVFDRGREWASLDRLIISGSPGATLGLVCGRRQGKTYLLESLVEAHGGLYASALQQSSRQNLDRVAQAYARFTGTRARAAFDSWEEALTVLLSLGEGAEEPVVVVLDELSCLLDAAPEIPSLLQHLLSPRGPAATSWRTRLVLCGSALSTMRSLLAGNAPLRGRAALAMRLHALVGGTPEYLGRTPRLWTRGWSTRSSTRRRRCSARATCPSPSRTASPTPAATSRSWPPWPGVGPGGARSPRTSDARWARWPTRPPSSPLPA